MNTVEALGHTIRRADETAHLFGVTPDLLAESLRGIGHAGEPGRSEHAADTMLGAFIDIAEAHRRDCGQGGCPTCLAIRDAFAAHLAGLRTLRMDAIERTRWDLASRP